MDVSIDKIVNVCYVKTQEWQRDFFAPRHKDGIVFILDGKIKYSFSSGDFISGPNDFLVLPATIPYSGKSLSNGLGEFIIIDFLCNDINGIAKLGLPYVISGINKQYGHSIANEILSIWNNQYIDAPIRVKSLLYKLIHDLFVTTIPVTNDSTTKIIEYINTHISDHNLSVQSICKQFFISESQLRRNILKVSGLSTNAYILSLRMKKAADDIIRSEKTIKEISSSCGFSSQYYFSKCFHEKYGYSPTKYKKIYFEKNDGNLF